MALPALVNSANAQAPPELHPGRDRWRCAAGTPLVVGPGRPGRPASSARSSLYLIKPPGRRSLSTPPTFRSSTGAILIFAVRARRCGLPGRAACGPPSHGARRWALAQRPRPSAVTCWSKGDNREAGPPRESKPRLRIAWQVGASRPRSPPPRSCAHRVFTTGHPLPVSAACTSIRSILVLCRARGLASGGQTLLS